jgi:poly-beta-1,6-N-acetyl-D-glucosamine synthase
MTRILFWIAIGFPFYVYIGFPILLRILQAVIRSRPRKEPITPSVSLLVAAYNEADVIGEKIRNGLNLDYPADRLEIVVASDGSKDSTAQIVQSFVDLNPGRVRLLNYEKNRGKMAVLNDAIRELRGEIVAFSDASSMMAPDSVRVLVENFADPRVGAASGVYRLLKKDQAQLGASEDLYWKYETFLKVQEARLGAFTGAHGSLYAIRRDLYPFPSASTINDDFTIPMRILEHGHRVAYEPAAVAYEEAQEMEGFSRRVRIMAGNIEQMREIRRLLGHPFVLFCLLSHKTGRLFVPIFMVVAVAANIALRHQFPYTWLWLAQCLFYALALLGAKFALKPKVLRLPYYFCMINSALFAWIYQAIQHGRIIPSRIDLDALGRRNHSGDAGLNSAKGSNIEAGTGNARAAEPDKKNKPYQTARNIVKFFLPHPVLLELAHYRKFPARERNLYLKLRMRDSLGMNTNKKPSSLARVHSVLFVCFGNIMRSPMCEVLMKRDLASAPNLSLAVTSAGLHAAPGREAHTWAQAAAADFGVSLRDHHARLLTQQMIDEANLVFAMDYQNQVELLTRYPAAKTKIVMLSAFADRSYRQIEIRDPYYGDESETRRCYGILEQCIRNLVAELAIASTSASQTDSEPIAAPAIPQAEMSQKP